MTPQVPPPAALSYFVDEAGDPTLFGARGKVLVGTEGCSRHFMLGVLHVDDVQALSAELQTLRQSLLADPYFKRVCFARRGSSDRSQALCAALEKAGSRFAHKWNRPMSSNIQVRESSPIADTALQATDYFLWALQRYFERQESRYLELVWPQVALVHAVDQTHRAPYGEYYTKKKPLV